MRKGKERKAKGMNKKNKRKAFVGERKGKGKREPNVQEGKWIQ